MARSEDENESSRRLKTEFLVQTDGIAAATNARVILIAATNRPGELDTAALRRFVIIFVEKLLIIFASPREF